MFHFFTAHFDDAVTTNISIGFGEGYKLWMIKKTGANFLDSMETITQELDKYNLKYRFYFFDCIHTFILFLVILVY